MKNSWTVWIVVLGALVAILLYLNLASTQDMAVVNPFLVSDEKEAEANTPYVFMDSQTQPLPSPPSVPASPVPVAKIAGSLVKTVAAKPVPTVAPATAKGIPVKKKYTIQAATFKDKNYAGAELKKALAAGLPAYLVTVDLKEKGFQYRICVGKFAAKAEAVQLLPQVKKMYKDGFVLVVK